MQIWQKNRTLRFIEGLFLSSKKLLYFIFAVYMLYGFYFGNWRTESIIQHDVIIYYEYLTATFMFDDLSFNFASDLPDNFDGQIWLTQGEDGEQFPKMTMGVAIMLTPLYMLAFGMNKLASMGSYGYSSFFQFFVFLSAVLYAMAAAYFQRKILKRFFEERVVAMVLISIFLCTNLFYYSIVESGMSHVYSFFLFTIIIEWTIRWHEDASFKNSLILGVVIGLIVLIRPTNAIIGVIPVVYQLFSKADRAYKFDLIKKNIFKAFIAVVVCCLFVSLQFIFWKYSTGKWFVYGYSDEGFFFKDPKIFKTLFSFRKGFFIYAPVLLFSLFGIFLSKGNWVKLKFPALLFLLINIYIVSSWWCWWYGGSMGQRALIESIAILSIFMGVFYKFIYEKKRVLKLGMYFAITFFFVLNSVQMIQYKKGILHWHGMTFEAYKNIFFKLKYPENYSDYIVEPDYDATMKGDR